MLHLQHERTSEGDDHSESTGAQPALTELPGIVLRPTVATTALSEARRLAVGAAAGSRATPSVAVAAGRLSISARPNSATTGNLVDRASAWSRTAGRSRWAGVHVEPSAHERLEHRWLVAVNDCVVGRLGVIVRVWHTVVGARTALGIVALDGDLAKCGKIITVVLDILTVPVDGPASPVNCTLGVGVGTTRPDGQLYTRRRLGEVILVGCRVESLRLLLGSADLTVYKPCDVIGCPPDLILMEILESVGKTDIARVDVWTMR